MKVLYDRTIEIVENLAAKGFYTLAALFAVVAFILVIAVPASFAIFVLVVFGTWAYVGLFFVVMVALTRYNIKKTIEVKEDEPDTEHN